MSFNEIIDTLKAADGCEDEKDFQGAAFHVMENASVVPLYMGNMELLIGLSLSCIAASVLFKAYIVDSDPSKFFMGLVTVSWMFFVVSVGSSLAYIFGMTRHVDARFNCSEYTVLGKIPIYFIDYAVFAFGMGFILLAIAILRELFKRQDR